MSCAMAEGNASFTGRVREPHRIPVDISIRIRLPTRLPNRILTDESRGGRIVIPVPVVVQPVLRNVQLFAVGRSRRSCI
jgi:hypothetical protein